jgi:hypothetical protein
MNDPAAAQFKDKITHQDWACISVDGKNSFGGYVGFKRLTMHSLAGDDWKTVSDKDKCTEKTLVELATKFDSDLQANIRANDIAETQLLAVLKESKLLPANATSITEVNGAKCSAAVFQARITRSMSLALQYSSGTDTYKVEYAKILDNFKHGICELPAGIAPLGS